MLTLQSDQWQVHAKKTHVLFSMVDLRQWGTQTPTWWYCLCTNRLTPEHTQQPFPFPYLFCYINVGSSLMLICNVTELTSLDFNKCFRLKRQKKLLSAWKLKFESKNPSLDIFKKKWNVLIHRLKCKTWFPHGALESNISNEESIKI